MSRFRTLLRLAQLAVKRRLRRPWPDPVAIGGHAQISRLEASILASNAPLIDLPLVHRFTPGLYAREIFMPSGSIVTSKIHKTQHPFVVLSGKASVFVLDDAGGERVIEIEAPHIGITEPGTRRVLYIREDCRWVTFHPTKRGEKGEQDLWKIEKRIIEQPLLSDGTPVFQRYMTKLKEQNLIEGVAS